MFTILHVAFIAFTVGVVIGVVVARICRPYDYYLPDDIHD